MGYQRGERGRLPSLIAIVILGAAVVSIDHISGRSVRVPARSEAANQVISMDIAGGNADSAGVCAEAPPAPTCRNNARLKASAKRARCDQDAPAASAIQLKAREAKEPVAPKLAWITEIGKKPSFLELQVNSIPPLEKRLIAVASQVTSIRSVSIRLEGEVRISKSAIPTAAQLYLIRAIPERAAKTRASRFEPARANPTPAPSWKCLKAES